MKRFVFTIILTAAVVYALGAENDVVLTKERMQVPCSIINIEDDIIHYYVWGSKDSIQNIALEKVDKIYWNDRTITDFNREKPEISLLLTHIKIIKPSENLSTQQQSVVCSTDTSSVQSSDVKGVNVSDNIKNDIHLVDSPLVAETIATHDTIETVDENIKSDVISEHTFVESGYILSDSEKKQKALCNVHKHTGIYIFNDNEPICDYTILGRCKVVINWSSEYEGVRNHLVKKSLKNYPDADALILELADGGTDWAVVIKFNNRDEKSKWGYAKVESFNGLYVFSDCEPINSYTIIGRSKSSVTWSGQYDAVKANLIKKSH